MADTSVCEIFGVDVVCFHNVIIHVKSWVRFWGYGQQLLNSSVILSRIWSIPAVFQLFANLTDFLTSCLLICLASTGVRSYINCSPSFIHCSLRCVVPCFPAITLCFPCLVMKLFTGWNCFLTTCDILAIISPLFNRPNFNNSEWCRFLRERQCK